MNIHLCIIAPSIILNLSIFSSVALASLVKKNDIVSNIVLRSINPVSYAITRLVKYALYPGNKSPHQCFRILTSDPSAFGSILFSPSFISSISKGVNGSASVGNALGISNITYSLGFSHTNKGYAEFISPVVLIFLILNFLLS